MFVDNGINWTIYKIIWKMREIYEWLFIKFLSLIFLIKSRVFRERFPNFIQVIDKKILQEHSHIIPEKK